MSDERKAALNTAQLVLTILNILIGSVVVIGGPIWIGRQLERFDGFSKQIQNLTNTVNEQANTLSQLGQENAASRRDREYTGARLTRIEEQLDRLTERRNPNS